ncbi:acetolactate synthase-1/2/3 large subunit [Sulfuritortus calidifontis]|uniref:Acetolactate synthase-1/2/3 large subunit n=1 Tax=Sulfuritortus calidifontis TaxID=1914471 RepID=A0A4V2UQ88_9PROT|nr:thiamine pyrophosphate-binding protein [Sulfuritortus calidifontis]TCS68996.1 acetolactate synthase-1/2/3 large subunit [Sulfuritortus calidifontis]
MNRQEPTKQPAPENLPVSEILVRFVEKLGVQCIFGIPGSHILPVYDALYDSPVRSVLVKHEQAAAFMAGGYARVSGGVGACITTAGPGATNLVTAIASAYADHLPVLAITGEAPTYIFGKGGLQESSGEGGSIDQVALFAGITRYHKLIERTDYLATVLNQAAKHLLSKTPGPVVLSIPYNIQKELVDASILDGIAFGRANGECGMAPNAIEQSVALIRAARRPLIVAGYGCIRAGAQAALSRISERLNIPVTSSLKAKGAIDERSALALGSLGVTSGGHAMRYLEQEADLVLVLGASFNERTSYVWDKHLLAGKKIIQVDNSAQQLEKVFRADLTVHTDLGTYLKTLDAALQAQAVPAKSPVDIAAFIKQAQAEFDAAGETIFDKKFDQVRALYGWLERKFPDGLVMFDDNIVFAQNFYRVSAKDRFYPNTGISALGHAVPAAIGAGCAVRQPLFAMIGDGGFHMCAMEIMTAVNYQVPLNIVLFNNNTMGLIRKNQHHLYQDRFIDCDFVNPDYALLARSFGINHVRVESEADLARLEAVNFRQGINLIEVMIERDAYPNYSSRR